MVHKQLIEGLTLCDHLDVMCYMILSCCLISHLLV